MRTALVQTFVSLVRRSSVFCFVAIVMCSGMSPAIGQGSSGGRGVYPTGSYAVSDLDNVNTVSGNLMIRIPIASLPPGRGGLSAGVSLVYNSKIYDTIKEFGYDMASPPDQANWDEVYSSPEGGWRFAYGYQLRVEFLPGNDDQFSCPELPYRYKLMMSFPDGSSREFRPVGYAPYSYGSYYAIMPDGYSNGGCYGGYGYFTTAPMVYFSTDGSSMRLVVQHDSDTNWQNNPWTLYTPDGGRVTYNEPNTLGQRIYDRNGHFIEIRRFLDSNNYPITWIIDQLGRYIEIGPGPGAGQNSVKYKGYNGQWVTWTMTWSYLTPGYFWRYYSTGGSTQVPLPGQSVVTQITPPTQTGLSPYTFTYTNDSVNYNGIGEIRTMTLPSGAQTTYSYNITGYSPSGYEASRNRVNRKDLTYNQEYDGSSTPTTDTWLYGFSSSGYTEQYTVTNPDGGIVRQWANNDFTNNYENFLVYKTEHANGDLTEQTWSPNSLPAADTGNYLLQLNPYVKTEYKSIKDAAGTLSKTAITDYSYDKNGNLLQVTEYDWVAYSSVPRGGNGKPTGIPAGATIKRVTVNAYHSTTPNATDTTTNSSNAYQKTSAPNLLRAIASSEVKDSVGGAANARTEYTYDSATATGNITVQKSWDSAKGSITNPANYISITNSYTTWSDGTTGRLDQTTDANGNVTKFYYADLNGTGTEIYPTQHITAYGTAVARTSNMSYDFSTGAVNQATDANNNVSVRTTYDIFGRPTLVENLSGTTTILRRATTEYSDASRYVIKRSDKDTVGDLNLVEVQHFDQLGRLRLSRTMEDSVTQSVTSETTGIKVQLRYKFSGSNSYQLTSNPYRAATSSAATAEGTMGWSRQKSDQSGRVLEVETFAGNALPSPWGSNTASTGKITTAYDAENVLVTDQQGKQRLSKLNALGQLTDVWEITASDSATESVTFNAATLYGYRTTYTYDPLNSLLTVKQQAGTSGTTQMRTFSYSSLKRLTSAVNPESGTTSYTYDNNGNILTRTDARSVVTTTTYDALNRPVSKTYTTGTNAVSTPSVNYYYDNQSLPSGAPSYTRGPSVGQLVAVTYGGGSEGSYFAYDALSRVTQKWQRTGTTNYPIQASYNLAGAMTGETYPSTHTVSYSYDTAGRPATFSGSLGDGTARTYTTGITYNPAGLLKREQFATTTGLYHRRHYNNRLQVYDIRLGTDASTTLDSDDPNVWQYATGSWDRGALRLYYATSGGGYVIGNGGTNNNGNPLRVDHFMPADPSLSNWAMNYQEYLYDSLNRLQKVTESAQTPSSFAPTFQRSFNYDRWGNRTIDQGAGTSWVEDSVPTGATAVADTDGWNWVTSNPVPSSGTSAHQSANVAGGHQHYFYGATQTLSVSSGDYLYAYVYLDPSNLPSEVMLQWHDGANWEHRAYWGSNLIGWGTDGTNSRRYMGPLPASGGWVRLEVPATQVGLGGSTLNGMAFTLYNGKATWDRAGKTSVPHGSVNDKLYTVDTATNRLQAPSGYTALQYDAAGNLKYDGYTDPNLGNFKYDAENKLREVYSYTSSLAAQYIYDGEGQRVKRIIGTNETWLVYGISGELIAEYPSTATTTVQKEYGYRLGQMLITAEANGNVKWLVTDQLGSPRMVIDKSGRLTDDPSTSSINEALERHDYQPFGEEIGTSVGVRGSTYGFGLNSLRQKFTGFERDSESGLDFAQARYYASVQGRFTSPDDFLNDTTQVDPSRWNLYAYVKNNPLAATDPTGEKIYVGIYPDPNDLPHNQNVAELIRRLEFTYKCTGCITVDNNGYLDVNTTNLSNDVKKATETLTKAIKDQNWEGEVFFWNNNNQVHFAKSAHGVVGHGGKTVDAIYLDFDDEKGVQGDKRVIQAFAWLNFAHEVFHLYPNGGARDPAPGVKDTGPVVDMVNEIALALGLPIRAEYEGRINTVQNMRYLWYGEAKKNKDGTVKRDAAGKIELKTFSRKVINWNITYVKGMN